MEYQFNVGDRVKLKPLDTLKKYFEAGRRSLSSYGIGNTILKRIEEGWYTPTERDYDKLIKLNFKVDHYQEHQIMELCCFIVADTGEYYRYPEGWLEKRKDSMRDNIIKCCCTKLSSLIASNEVDLNLTEKKITIYGKPTSIPASHDFDETIDQTKTFSITFCPFCGKKINFIK